MARVRARKAIYPQSPWSYHKCGGACKARTVVGELPQQLHSASCSGKGRRLCSRNTHFQREYHKQRLQGAALPFRVVGPFYAPFTTHFPGHDLLFDGRYPVNVPQRPCTRRRRANRRWSKRLSGAHGGVNATVLACPPAPYLDNSFYMNRAQQQRAESAACQQAQVEAKASTLWCPPAPLLSNEYYMRRAEEERAAAAVQQEELAAVSAQMPLLEQQPHLPGIPNKHQMAQLVEAVVQQDSAAVSSFVASPPVLTVTKDQHMYMEGLAQHACMAAEAEEEVCTWDPDAQVVVESF